VNPAERIAAAEADMAALAQARFRLRELLEADRATMRELLASTRRALYAGTPPPKADMARLAQVRQSADVLADALRLHPLDEARARLALAEAIEAGAIAAVETATANLADHQARQASLLTQIVALEGGAASVEIAGDVSNTLRQAIAAAQQRAESATQARRRYRAELEVLAARPEYSEAAA
jgi:hypothetical protein